MSLVAEDGREFTGRIEIRDYRGGRHYSFVTSEGKAIPLSAKGTFNRAKLPINGRKDTITLVPDTRGMTDRNQGRLFK